jgi:DNA-binding NarL/FixJ family response regulator
VSRPGITPAVRQAAHYSAERFEDWEVGLGAEPIESLCESTPSGNPLDLLKPRQRAVLVLLGSGLDATTVAELLHISRETLYQDRRRAWRTIQPVIPVAIGRAYDVTRRPGAAQEVIAG